MLEMKLITDLLLPLHSWLLTIPTSVRIRSRPPIHPSAWFGWVFQTCSVRRSWESCSLCEVGDPKTWGLPDWLGTPRTW